MQERAEWRKVDRWSDDERHSDGELELLELKLSLLELMELLELELELEGECSGVGVEVDDDAVYDDALWCCCWC